MTKILNPTPPTGPGMAGVNYDRAFYAGLPAPLNFQGGNGTRQDLRNWLSQVDPQRLADQFGYVRGAHGVTPDSFKGTNAYKGK